MMDQVNLHGCHETDAPSGRAAASRLAAIPTANGAISRAAYRRLTRAGLDARPMLDKAGLTTRTMREPNVRFPVKNQIAFLNAASRALDCEFLGLELARDVELRELGLVYYIQASSASLGDALRAVTRYSRIHNEGVVLRYTQQSEAAVTFSYVGVARTGDYHQTEFFAAALLRACRHITGRNLSPAAVRFVHRRQHVP